MRLFFTSRARAQGLLGDPQIRLSHRQTNTEIGFGLSLIHDREWQSVIVTIDVKNRLEAVMIKVGTQFMPHRKTVIFQEDDLPTIGKDDKVIIVNDDDTITVAEYKLAEAA